METTIISDDEVKKLLNMSEALEVVEVAFKHKGLGLVQMPAKIYLYYSKYDGDLRTMPGYLAALDVSAVKIVNVHPNNPAKRKMPTVMAVIILIDPKTGGPLAIMGGTTITDMRTGAAGGIAAKYLARTDSRVVGLVGAGAQARTQLASLIEVFPKLEEVRVWSRSSSTIKRFVVEMNGVFGDSCKIITSPTIKDTVKEADIITTTTPSRTPLVMSEMVRIGTHINCIGADAMGKQELDPKILRKAKIVIDDWEQACHSGEINVPVSQGKICKRNIWAEIGEIVAGLKSGRQNAEEITVFTSTGLAVQDAITAKLVYDKALSNGVGEQVRIV
jgi:alanine dehydrogenase